MRLSEYFFFTLVLSIIIFSTGLLAQDSTVVNAPEKLLLIDDTILTGKIISKDSLAVQIQLNNGKIRRVRKVQIKSSQKIADIYRKISPVRNLKLDLKDGSDVVGKIVSVSDTTLSFRTLSGIDMVIPILAINNYDELNGNVAGDIYYRKDPNQSRLFINSTALPIGSGNVYFSDYMVFFPSFAVGIGNVISFSAGMTLIPGADNQIFFVNLKVTVVNTTFSENNLCIAAGGMFANITDGNANGQSALYGLATYSRSVYSLTLGFTGFPSDNGNGTNLLLFGGSLRLSQSVKLISENYYSSNNNRAIYSMGLRFFGEKVAADFGLFTTADMLDQKGFPFIPWVGFAYNF
jgi:hypothetical protein